FLWLPEFRLLRLWFCWQANVLRLQPRQNRDHLLLRARGMGGHIFHGRGHSIHCGGRAIHSHVLVSYALCRDAVDLGQPSPRASELARFNIVSIFTDPPMIPTICCPRRTGTATVPTLLPVARDTAGSEKAFSPRTAVWNQSRSDTSNSLASARESTRVT